MLEMAKPGGFASVTTSLPKQDSVPLGRVLRGLSDRLATEAPGSFEDTLDLFLEEHERYASATRLASMASSQAVKSWAAERLPAIGIPYGYSNKIAATGIKENLDEQASLRLVEFADELALIAAYGRNVLDLKIEAAPHSHGYRYHFFFHGTVKSEACASIEEASIQALLNMGARDNTIRRRIVCTEDRIEAECIAVRKKMRLGFSPLL